MSDTAKKVLGIIAFGILAECAVLLLIDAIILFVNSGSYGAIIAAGVISVIEFIILAILAIRGLVVTAQDGFDDSVNYLRASYFIDLLFVILTTIITMANLPIVSGALIVVLIFAILAAICFLISMFMENEIPACIFSLIGIGILLIVVPVRIVALHQTNVTLGFSISDLTLLVLSIILFISLMVPTRYRRARRQTVTAVYRLGEYVYTKYDLFDHENHKIPALSQVVIESRKQDGFYKISYFDDYHGTLYVENVRSSCLSRVRPSAASTYAASEPVNPAQPRPANPAPSSSNIADKLKELQQLRSSGLITEEEYQEKRKKYVDKL